MLMTICSEPGHDIAYELVLVLSAGGSYSNIYKLLLFILHLHVCTQPINWIIG